MRFFGIHMPFKNAEIHIMFMSARLLKITYSNETDEYEIIKILFTKRCTR